MIWIYMYTHASIENLSHNLHSKQNTQRKHNLKVLMFDYTTNDKETRLIYIAF